MKYKTSSAIVDAWQSFDDCGTYTTEWPRWILDALKDKIVTHSIRGPQHTTILTQEDQVIEVKDSDWIILYEDGKMDVMKDLSFSRLFVPHGVPTYNYYLRFKEMDFSWSDWRPCSKYEYDQNAGSTSCQVKRELL